jgi:integrase
MQSNPSHAGIRVRHSRTCRSHAGGSCNCGKKKSYEAWAYSRRDQKKVRKTFSNLAEAKAWRADTISDIRKHKVRAGMTTTIEQAADAWLEGARSGTIRKKKGGEAYKPSAIRTYENALRQRVLPKLGDKKLSEVTRNDLQDFADELLGAGTDPSTIRNTFMPVRAIYRRVVARGEVGVNPTTGLELPSVNGKRDRIAAPDEAAKLIAAVPEPDRAIWATAFYGGLRLGELRALDWEHVDFTAGVIRVDWAWDAKEGRIRPKSSAGIRSVPMPTALRTFLREHRLREGRSTGFVFRSSSDNRPFDPPGLIKRADKAWEGEGLDRITLHDCRHTFASLMIAAMTDAGKFNAKALSVYMGHSSIQVTYDRYGHLFPGNEKEAAALLDVYLKRQIESARSGVLPL